MEKPQRVQARDSGGPGALAASTCSKGSSSVEQQSAGRDSRPALPAGSSTLQAQLRIAQERAIAIRSVHDKLAQRQRQQVRDCLLLRGPRSVSCDCMAATWHSLPRLAQPPPRGSHCDNGPSSSAVHAAPCVGARARQQDAGAAGPTEAGWRNRRAAASAASAAARRGTPPRALGCARICQTATKRLQDAPGAAATRRARSSRRAQCQWQRRGRGRGRG